MKFIFKRNVVEWYMVEAETEEEAGEMVGQGLAPVVNQDEGDLILVGQEEQE